MAKVRDLLVVLLCLLGAAFSFTMFWKDLNSTMDRFAEPLGSITYKRQAAQRRFSNRVLWTRLSRDAPVYQGDYIRTAELSEATVHFPDGTDISLAENTLIQVRIEDGKNIIELAGGDLSIVAGENAGTIHVLVSGETRMELGPGAVVSASSDGSGGFTMTVLEGTVASGGEQLGAGESFSTVPEEARAVPLLPRPDTCLLAPDGTALLRFGWSRINYSGSTRFELARDRRFKQIEMTRASQEESLSAELSPGVYWWRVYPEPASDAAGPEPSAGKIMILPPVTPELISPAEGQVFYHDKTAAGPELRFLWKSAPFPASVPDTGEFILEIADNSGFTNPRLSVNVQGTENASLVYGGLEDGQWYWRVRQRLPGLESPLVSVSYFSITSEKPPEAPPPEAPAPLPAPEPALQAPPEPRPEPAVTPEPEPAAEPATLLPPPTGMSPADRHVVGPEQLKTDRRLVFSWNAVPGANSYIFTLLEETGEGSRLILSVEGRQSSYTIEDLRFLERGSFVWQVEAVRRTENRIEQRGRPGGNRFTVDVPVPENPRVRDTGVLYGQ
jgi:hypothetical protein